jgi:hypothetical protein
MNIQQDCTVNKRQPILISPSTTGISGLDEAISDGYDSENGESSASSILSNKPPEDMPKSLASLFSRGPSAEPTAPEPNPRIKLLAPFKIIIDDEGDTKDSPRSNNSNGTV